MPRKTSKEPTDAELRILNCLWEADAMRLSEIAAALHEGGESLANTTIATTLKVMSQKKLVRRTTRGGNTVWVASVSRESASRGSVDRLLDRLFDGSASQLVAHLISGKRLSDHDKKEIEALLRADATKQAKPTPKKKKK